MITKEEVAKIALLSKLYLSDEALEAMTTEMASIVAFADTINGAVTDDTTFDNINHLYNVYREDVVVPSYPREAILRNVDGGENGFFPVKRRMP